MAWHRNCAGPTRPTSLAVANYKTSSPRALTAAPLLCSTATDAAVMKPAPPAAAPVPVTKIAMPASAAVSAEAALLGKGRYKVWALAAIAVLALWSMSAASVSLRWSSSGDLAAFSGDLDVPLGEDLDSLEMEEREKLVGRMWEMYTRTSDEVRLPRFWQEAFEAAYEELAGDDKQVRDAAISELARMSAHKLEIEQTVNENEEQNASSNRGGRAMGK